MMNMMKDLDGAEMNKQLETLGLSPSEVINKIMAEPELAAAFQKPKVMQVAPTTLLLYALISTEIYAYIWQREHLQQGCMSNYSILPCLQCVEQYSYGLISMWLDSSVLCGAGYHGEPE